jgi:uncharacterized protein YjiS (DUF1127 family)
MTSTAIQIPTLKAPALMRLLGCVTTYRRRRATRRQLESLTLDQLRDVGIDPDVISRGHPVPGDPWTMSRLMSLR